MQTDADAVLCINVFQLGYAEWEDSGFTPQLMAYTELFNRSSENIIYSRLFYIGRTPPINAEIIFLDEKYKYDSFETLITNFDEAAQGLIDCQNKIATRIAEHLK